LLKNQYINMLKISDLWLFDLNRYKKKILV